jgi:Zn-dependent peptidase ImmA (M78 family)
MKPEWKVAMQALLMRVSALGLIDPNQSRYLWQKISARGWKLKEPPELDFPQETPRVLPRIIKAHLEDLRYSKKELADLLRIHEGEFEKMYGTPPPNEPARPRLRIVG